MNHENNKEQDQRKHAKPRSDANMYILHLFIKIMRKRVWSCMKNVDTVIQIRKFCGFTEVDKKNCFKWDEKSWMGNTTKKIVLE